MAEIDHAEAFKDRLARAAAESRRLLQEQRVQLDLMEDALMVRKIMLKESAREVREAERRCRNATVEAIRLARSPV